MERGIVHAKDALPEYDHACHATPNRRFDLVALLAVCVVFLGYGCHDDHSSSQTSSPSNPPQPSTPSGPSQTPNPDYINSLEQQSMLHQADQEADKISGMAVQ